MKLPLIISVNGEEQQVAVDPRTTLVDLLREGLDLTGTHVGCRTGHCGACTVLLDGEPVKSCCVLALEVEGRKIETVEGLADRPDSLHPIQEAFVAHQGLQCGYCTPGMVLSAKALLRDDPDPDEARIREAISGNLCRCTGYQNIVASIRAAARSEE